MECKVDGCKEKINSKIGYCKKHREEREELINKIRRTNFIVRVRLKSSDLDKYSYQGIKEIYENAKKWG